MIKFEVGKKYKLGNSNIFHTFIGYASNNRRVWEKPNGIIWDETTLSDDWQEYKEPVIHTRYVHWFKGLDGTIGAITTKTTASENHKPTPITTTKVTYTDVEG